MNKKLIFVGIITALTLTIACNSNDNTKKDEPGATATTESTPPPSTETANPKGIGSHQSVELTHPLNEKMVSAGKSIYDIKCGSCHKLTDEKLVGPGWKGVTDRRTPEWIMNFVTNTEEMLDKDVTAKSLVEVCMVKMPNQNLSEADARSVLEFMRKNDGKN